MPGYAVARLASRVQDLSALEATRPGLCALEPVAPSCWVLVLPQTSDVCVKRPCAIVACCYKNAAAAAKPSTRVADSEQSLGFIAVKRSAGKGNQH